MKGVQHHLLTAALIFPVGWAGMHFTGDSVIAIAMGVGCAVGLVIHPDVDQCEYNCRGFKKTVFWLYGKLFHHRGISHWPLIGTLSRLIYLGWPFALFYLAIGHPYLPGPAKVFVWVALGLALSDLGHCILDIKF